MNDEIFFDGVRYISANDAALNSGFTRDYVGRLCRDGKVHGRRVGKNWYVDSDSFKSFLITQEFAKSRRNETLAQERAKEYRSALSGPAAVLATVPPALAAIPDGLTQRGNEIRAKLQNALDAPASPIAKGYQSLSHLPSGFTSAALQAAHIPTYAITPFAEFLHKVVALTLTLALVLGTYAAVDPQYAHFAAQSAQDTLASAVDSYNHATGGGISALSDRTQSQIETVAENPQVAASAIAGAFSVSLPNLAAELARSFNTGVNNFVYSIAFPANLINSLGIARNSGSVALEVLPNPQQTTSGIAVSAPAPAKAVSGAAGSGQSVIERVVTTERVVSAGGISETELNDKLNQLSNKLTSQIFSITSSASTPPSSGGIVNNIALSQRIDQLDGTQISNATISGSTISNSPFSDASVSATDLSASGQTSLASTTISGSLNVSGAVQLKNITLASSTLSITGETSQTSNLIQVTDASGTVVFAVEPDGTLITNNSSSTQIFTSLLVAGGATTTTFHSDFLDATNASTTNLTAVNSTTTNATSTNFFATNASTTNLVFQNATGTNAVITNATSTNLFAVNASTTNATSTNLFAVLGHFTTGVIDTLNSAVAAITSLTATNFVATNSTTTNATTTNFFATNASTTNATSTNLFVVLGHLTTGVVDSLSSAVATITSLASTNFVATNATTTNATSTNFFATNASTTNATSTSLFSVLGHFTTGVVDSLSSAVASIASLTATNLVATNSTTTNATSTNFFATTASSTNLFSTNLAAGAALLGNATTTTLFSSTASSTNLFAQNAAIGSLTSNTFTIGSLVGPLQAINGVVSASSTLSTFYGGTGANTFALNGVLFGNGVGPIQATAAAANSILVTNGSNVPSFSTTLPAFTLGGTVSGGGQNVIGINNLSATGLSQLANASSSLFSVFTKAYFGGTATTTIDSAGNVAVAGTLNVSGNTTLSNATSSNLFSSVASSTNLFSQSAALGVLNANSVTLPNFSNVLLYADGSNRLSSATIASSLTFSGGALSVNLANPNSWTDLQQFSNSTSTELSATQKAYFGTTGQSSFDFNGVLTLGTALGQASGGTGIGSYTAGDILYADNAGTLKKLPIGSTGNVLTVAAGLPAWGAGGGGGGGGASGVWATTTNNLITYPSPTSFIVVVGANATSTLNSIFEVHGNEYVSGNIGIATTSPSTDLSVGGNGYFTGGLGVGVLNTLAGTFQTLGNATIGGTLLLPAVSTNSILYNNGFNQVAAATVGSSLTFSAGNLSLNTANPNTWSVLQTFSNASSTFFSNFGTAYFGGTATTTIDSAGNVVVGGSLTAGGNVTLGNATTTNLFSTTASSTNLFSQTAALGTLSLVNALPIASGGTNATSFTTGQPLAYDGTRFVSTSTLSAVYGGTGINNGAKTITLGGNISTGGTFTTSGASALTLTTTGTTNSTLPSGTHTLVGQDTTDTLTNKTFDSAGTGNVLQISGTTVTGATGNGGILVFRDAPTFTTGITTPAITDTVTTGTGDSFTSLTTGTAINITPTSAAGTSGTGITFNTTSGLLTTASALNVTGSADMTNNYTGAFVNITPTRNVAAAATRVHSGNITNVAPTFSTSGTNNSIMTLSGTTSVFKRTLSNAASGGSSAINVTAPVMEISNLTTNATRVTDTSSLLSLLQLSTTASGPALFLNNQGTGPMAVFTGLGNFGIGTTTPGATFSVEGKSLLGNSATAGFFTATTTSTNTFPTLLSTNATTTTLFSTTASSTNLFSQSAAVGSLVINSLSGLLQGNGTSNVTAVTGTAGQFPYYNGTNTLLATSTLFVSTASNVGIGTTTPWGKLAVSTAAQQSGTIPLFNIASTTNASLFSVLGNGNTNIAGQVGIGTTNPLGFKLYVTGGPTDFENGGVDSMQPQVGFGVTAAPGLFLQSIYTSHSAVTNANNSLAINLSNTAGITQTTPAFKVTGANTAGFGTSTPYATLSVQANNGDTNTTLFAIASSTVSATTTLFSINNTGVLNLNPAAQSGDKVITFFGQNFLSATSSSEGVLTLGYQAGNSLAATSSAAGNVALGYQALSTATSSVWDIAIGYQALKNTVDYGNGGGINSAVSGSGNVGIGFQSLVNNTSGSQNIALGVEALANNTTGTGNFAAGSGALVLNQNGGGNFALGASSLTNNVSGSNNVGVGNASLLNSAGNNNVGIGLDAGDVITSGDSNTFLGFFAGHNLTSGNSNVAIGQFAGFGNTSGSGQLSIQNILYGTSNTNTGGVPSSGQVGIGTASPFARFAIQANNGDTNTTLFAIASSTASATTTLFSVSNAGTTTIANGVNITAGCFASGGNCLTLGSFSGTLAIGNGGTNATSFTTGQPLAFDGTRFVSTSTLGVSVGGTGATSLTGILKGNGSGAFTAVTGTNNYLPKWSSNSLTGTSLVFDTGTEVRIGTTTNLLGNSSRLFIFGGNNGANIDAMGDPSIVGGDQAVYEAEGSDYTGANKSSVAIEYYGPGGLGTTAGYANQRLGILDFGAASTSIISTGINQLGANSDLIFANGYIQHAVLTGAGNLGLNNAAPINRFDIVNSPSGTSGNAGFGLLAASAVGTLTTTQTVTLNAATSTYAPTATLNAASAQHPSLVFNGSNQTESLSGITLGTLNGSTARNLTTGNGGTFTLLGSPVFNDTVGSGINNLLQGNAVNATVSLSPVNTAGSRNNLIASAGTFANTSSETGLSSATSYGLQVNNSSSLFNSSSNAYGGFFANGATASTTYGLYTSVNANSLSTSLGGNIAYGLYIAGPNTTITNDRSLYSSGSAPSYFAGSLGIGTTTPWGSLAISTAAQQDGTIPLFNIASTTNASLFVVNGNGNVGIGSSTPGSLLSVGGGNITQTAGNPTLASTTNTANAANAVFVSGRYAYVGENVNASGFQIYDVANPASPLLVSSFTPTGLVVPRSIVVSGRYAYVGGTQGNTKSSSLQVIDVTNPAAPVTVTNLNVSTNNLTAGSLQTQLYVSGKYLFFTAANINQASMVRIYDISNPASPTLTGTASLSSNDGGTHIVRGIYVSGRYAYITLASSGATGNQLEIFDISNSVSPLTPVGSFTTANVPSKVIVSGKYAYIAEEGTTGGLEIVNVSNPASPASVGSFNSANNVYALQLAGNYAYLGEAATTNGVEVVDVSNPVSPVKIGSYNTVNALADAANMQLSGNYLYIPESSATAGLEIVNISGANLPSASIGSLTTSNFNVDNNAVLGGDLYAQGGLNAGLSGIFSRGGLGVYIASTTQSNPASATFMGGNVGIGLINPTALLHISGAKSQTSWTTTGANLAVDANTLTDTTGSGTITTRAGSSLGIPTFASTNSVTLTNAATLYIDGAAAAGTNTTITNPFSLFVNAGTSYFGGNVGIGTTTPGAKFSVEGSSLLGNSATAGFFTATTTTASQFPNATSSLLSVTSKAYFGSTATTTIDSAGNIVIPSTASLTVANLSGAVSASGGVLSAGTLSIANGGTNATSQTSNGVNYFDGTRITSGTGLTFTGTNFGIGTTTPMSLFSASTNTFSNGSVYTEQRLDAQTTGIAAGTGFTTTYTSNSGIWGAVGGYAPNTTFSNTGLGLWGSQTGSVLSGAPALLVNGSGNVGIGTTTPSTLLTLSAQNDQLKIDRPSNAAANYALTVYSTGNVGKFFVGLDGDAGAGYVNVDKLGIFDVANNNSTPTMVFTGGNVGIGTGTSTPWGRLGVTGADTSATTPGFTVADSNNKALFNVFDNGKVGIGSTTPNYALDVNGDINIGPTNCYRINGVCIGYVVKLAAIYATSSVGSNDSIVFTGAVGSAPSFSGTTVTLPSNTSYITAELWGSGGGGGGGPATTDGSNGTGGNASCFGTNATACTSATMTANGGGAGNGGFTQATGGGGGSAGGSGGSATGGDLNVGGASGQIGGTGTSLSSGRGGPGGDAPRGGGGGAGGGGGGGTPGLIGSVFGGGGGGASGNNANQGGAGGGGSGGYSQKLITPATGTYHYTLGAGGPGGTAGTGGGAGGTGGPGGLVISVYATSSPNAAGNDLAEMFPVSNPGINAGDIVSVDAGTPISMKLAQAGDVALAGVVSTAPGQVLGDATATGMRPIALSGRIPTKVNLEGGPIHIGDRIAPSSVPGEGKKAGPFDASVGIALENYDGTQSSNQITVFLDLQQGIDINAIALKLLGSGNPLLSLGLTSDASSTSASSTSPVDFVGGMMSAITSRLSALPSADTSASSTATSTSATSTPLDTFASGLLQSIFGQLVHWFASAANGIGDFFANRVHTKELCVGDSSGETCITKTQLDSLLAGAAAAQAQTTGAGGSSSSSASTSTPVISISGANPATINIGDTYNDLGATITGPAADVNLGIEVVVDGGATTTPDKIQIDTSAAGTHTIIYSVTDPSGLTGTASRTVNVIDPTPPAPSSGDASSTPPADSGTSSDAISTATSTTP